MCGTTSDPKVWTPSRHVGEWIRPDVGTADASLRNGHNYVVHACLKCTHAPN